MLKHISHSFFFVGLAVTFSLGGSGGCASEGSPAGDPKCIGSCGKAVDEVTDFEYIVVGSGAGGGPLAANLARAGFRVLLLEAGGDTGGQIEYQVPAFHTLSTESESMQWDYLVDHYGEYDQQVRDSKMVYDHDGVGEVPRGILYPRSGTLGGCTAHNAMITVYPHDSDWNRIATLTGDESWNASQMRGYFQRVERNRYLDSESDLVGHGTDGWLQVERASPFIALGDSQLRRVVISSGLQFVDEQDRGFFSDLWATGSELVGVLTRDLNSAAPGRDQMEGLFQIPLATRDGRRNGTREYIIETAEGGHPLTVRTHALVSNVIFADEPAADGTPRAIGVEFLDGEALYAADPRAALGGPLPDKTRVTATREVILSAGAFNTPQLLMLSGIGPEEELNRFGIDVRVNLPGVGRNLQDRYEVGIVSQLDDDLDALDGCTFGQGEDPCLREWEQGEGVYTSNGGVVSIVKRSSVAEEDPDLIIFGLPGNFRGYYPGYSQDAVATHDHFTWAILKAHTRNRAGRVTLQTTDPRDRPDINFNYFQEGTNGSGEADLDMQAMVEGVGFVRRMIEQYNGLTIFNDMEEVYPTTSAVETDEEIASFVRDQSWGHHASCTAAIGADGDPMAVLDSRFRVRGVTGLRVVDASVFPEIPGFFIVTPIYMISEKATDVILEDALFDNF